MSDSEVIPKRRKAYGELVAGCFAGIGADFLLHPVDTVRATMQVERAVRGVKTATITQAATKIFKESGPLGFYRGVKTTVLITGPAHALYFFGYEYAKGVMKRLDPGHQKSEWVYALGSGLFANFCGGILWVPMDVVKQKMQVLGGTRYRRDLDAARDVLRTDGIRGLYRGFGAAFGTYGPFSALYFAIYEAQKSLYFQFMSAAKKDEKERKVPFYASLAFACGAGGIAAAATCPLDVVKTRMQVEGRSAAESYTNILHGLRTVAKKEGFDGLFRGVTPRMLWIAPSCAVTMVLYEEFKALLA